VRRPIFPPNPVHPAVIEQVNTSPAFDELFDDIVRTAPSPSGTELVAVPRRAPGHRLYMWAALAALVVLGIVLPIVLSSGGGALTRAVTTPFRASKPFMPSGTARPAPSGRWQLLGAVLSGSWTQNTHGPPDGALACGSTDACYVLSDKYASPNANAPLLSVSLFVTHDLGTTWSVLPMPKGFDPSSNLSCPDALSCGVGGVLSGQQVFLLTTDAGSQWTITPLKGLPGELVSLACSSATRCHGIVGPNALSLLNEAFVSTADSFKTWKSSAFPAVDGIYDLTCADAAHCLIIGSRSPGRAFDSRAEFVRLTSNSGATWKTGVLPKGFAGGEAVSCADAAHCLVAGLIQFDNNTEDESPVISTTNGGLTWTLDSLPSDVPGPQLSDISCPSTIECWAAGSEEVSESVGDVTAPDSSVLLGTTNGGATWSKVAFTVPTGAPNAYGLSYQSIGQVACPVTNACIALGTTVQSSPTAPVYRVVSQPSP
jgi:photosystem II stability/assembly factor-like uncharacterized protein